MNMILLSDKKQNASISRFSHCEYDLSFDMVKMAEI